MPKPRTPAEYREEDERNRERDAEWLRRIAAGGRAGEDAFRDLVRAYRGRFVRFFSRRSVAADSEEMEELLQSIWMEVVRSAKTTWRDEGKPSAWLWTVAGRVCFRELRNRVARQRYLVKRYDSEAYEAAVLAMPAPEARNLALEQCVEHAFAAFAWQHPLQAFLLRLYELEGMSEAELHALRGTKGGEGSTRKWLSKARARLEPLLRPCREHLPDRG